MFKRMLLLVALLLVFPPVVWGLLYFLDMGISTIAPPLKESDYETVVIMDKVDHVRAGDDLPRDYLSDRTRFVGFDGDSATFESLYPSRYADEVQTTLVSYKKGKKINVPSLESHLDITFADRKGDTLFFRVVETEKRVKDSVKREPFKVIREGEDTDE